MNNKGITAYLALAVLTAVFLIISLFLVMHFNKAVEMLPQRYQCIASTMTKNFVNKISPDLDFQMNCPPIELTLTGNEETAKRQLAEEMKNCWKAFGRGKYELFSKSGVYCHICAYVNVEEDRKDKVLNNFDDYLFETKIKGGDEYYMEYLAYNEVLDRPEKDVFKTTKEELDMKQSKGIENVNLETEHYIVFLYAKDNMFITDVVEQLGKLQTLGVISGTVATGVFIISGGVALPVTAGIIATGSFQLWDFFGKKNEDRISAVLLIKATSQEFNMLGCNYIPSMER